MANIRIYCTGYGSIPMKIPFLVGWTSILTQLFWCELQGYYWFWHTAYWEYQSHVQCHEIRMWVKNLQVLCWHPQVLDINLVHWISPIINMMLFNPRTPSSYSKNVGTCIYIYNIHGLYTLYLYIYIYIYTLYLYIYIYVDKYMYEFSHISAHLRRFPKSWYKHGDLGTPGAFIGRHSLFF